MMLLTFFVFDWKYSNQFRYQISAKTHSFDFLDQICSKRLFAIKNRKSKHHHQILHIRIGLPTKFQLKLIILIFWTKFTQKEYFQSKTKKVSSIIEFCIVELSQVPKFQVLWHFQANQERVDHLWHQQATWKIRK